MSASKSNLYPKKEVREIIEHEQTKSDNEHLLKGMKIVKSWDQRFPYRFIKGNIDYTPLKIKDKTSQELNFPIDMEDFASLFFTENFLPAKLPIFFFDETSSLITGFLTGSKYRYGASPLENLLTKYSKKEVKMEIPEKGMVVDMEPLKVIEPLVETFRVFLQETDTFNIFSRVSTFIDPETEPFEFYVESPLGEMIYHTVIKSKEISTESKEISTESKEISTESKEISTESKEISTENKESETPKDEKTKAVLFQRTYDNSASTMTPFKYDKATLTHKIDFKSLSISVSPSILHDSMDLTDPEEDKNPSFQKNIIDPRLCNADFEKASTNVLDSPSFHYVYNIIERILDANYYQKSQMLFENVHLNEDVDINHSLSSWITLKLPKSVCMNKVCEVTSLSWHPLNRHLLGVAYGKMHLEKKAKGMICLWNLKNPSLPERLYKFKFPIKCIAFSEIYPYALAVGFSNGHVAILNILAKKLVYICDTFKLLTDYMPVTYLAWFTNEYRDYFPVSSNESGEMYSYNLKRDFIPELLLDLPRNVESVKGIKQFSKYFHGKEDKMLLKISISTFVQHPKDPLHYLVGTYDGYVHICSLNYKSKAMEVFAAHEGPITNIEFHPKTENFFLTSGCDYYIRVWYCKIFKPLMSFTVRKEFLRNVKWCISNPLLIIALSEMYIDVWDLRRINDTLPVSTYENIDRISYLTFNVSPFGPNLMVGDVDGNAMLFMINETRSEPMFKIEILYSAIRSHIRCRDPPLWKRLKEELPECDVEVNDELVDVDY